MVPDVPIGATLLVGLLLGLRHALEADHLAAVATLVEGRGPLRRAALTGLVWGAGHAMTLALVGGALVALRVRVPERVAFYCEFGVALMLVGLGARALASGLRSRLHLHEHEHDGVAHAHLHLHAAGHDAGSLRAPHDHPHPLSGGLRPFLVGCLHGLAGTGALVLLVLTTLPTVLLGWLYLGIFGLGSIAGMLLMSLILGAPLALARRRAASLYILLRLAAGGGSVALGILLCFRIGARIF